MRDSILIQIDEQTNLIGHFEKNKIRSYNELLFISLYFIAREKRNDKISV